MNWRFPAWLLAILTCTTTGAAEQHATPQWIVVTAPAFQAALEPLCDHRRAEGMRVRVVRTTDILSEKQLREGDGDQLRQHIRQLCQQAKGPHYLLLVGAPKVNEPSVAVTTSVPTLDGTVGRMKGKPSDGGYGCLDENRLPTVAVGRFPARNEEEVRQMVQKTLKVEQDRSAEPWRNRLTLLVGNPGGASPIERRFAASFVQGVAASRFDRLHPMWTTRIVIHAPGSPFRVPNDLLRDVSLGYLQEGQVFSFYLGHSSAAGFWSDGAAFLSREDWAHLKIPSGQGVFFTCGCFGCQLDGADGEGYGIAAMRNPDGPVAVIGAVGESYGAMGQLAIDGMLECLSVPDPPQRLADYWLAAMSGLDHGKMDGITFWRYDQADGSRGKISLGVQRQEHLEMWMLLGDPALRLPIRTPTIELATADTAAAGRTVRLSGLVPDGFADAAVRLTLERPAGTPPSDLSPLPSEVAKVGSVMTANHKRSNFTVLERYEVRPRDGRFEHTLKLPADVPWPRLVVRALASSRTETAIGALSLPLKQQEVGQPEFDR